MKCCNDDCNQGRLCPDKSSSISTSSAVFTGVMGAITLFAGALICWWVIWWVITAVMMFVEVLK